MSRHTISRGGLITPFVILTAIAASSFRFLSNIAELGSSTSYVFAGLLVISLSLIHRLDAGKLNITALSMPETQLIFLWIIWAIVGHHPTANIEALIRNLGLSIMSFLLGVSAVQVFNGFRVVAYSLTYSGVVLLVIGVASILLGSSPFSTVGFRLGSNVGNANEWAYALFLCLLGVLYLATVKAGVKGMTLGYFLGALMIVTLILTGSRKVFLGALFFGAWIFFLGSGRFRRKVFFAFFGFVVTLVVFSSELLSSAFLWERMAETTSVQDVVLREQERIGHYVDLMTILASAPLQGVGLGGWQFISSVGKDPHSEYVAILGETGLIGGLLYFTAVGFTARNLFKSWLHSSRLAPNFRDRSRHESLFFTGILITLGLVAFGRWNYTSPLHFYVFGAIASRALMMRLMRQALDEAVL